MCLSFTVGEIRSSGEHWFLMNPHFWRRVKLQEVWNSYRQPVNVILKVGEKLCSSYCLDSHRYVECQNCPCFIWVLDASRDKPGKECPQVTEHHWCCRKAGSWWEFPCTELMAGQWKNLQYWKAGLCKESKKEKVQEDKGENKHLVLLL